LRPQGAKITHKKVEFSGPMVPARDHRSLKSKCLHHARLGWWLLDRYDHRK